MQIGGAGLTGQWTAGPDMAEIIDRTIHKLSDTTSAHLQEILDYPAENEGIWDDQNLYDSEHQIIREKAAECDQK